METFSALLALCEGNPPVTCGFPSQKPMQRRFDVFFHPRLNKWLSKQSRRLWKTCFHISNLSRKARYYPYSQRYRDYDHDYPALHTYTLTFEYFDYMTYIYIVYNGLFYFASHRSTERNRVYPISAFVNKTMNLDLLKGLIGTKTMAAVNGEIEYGIMCSLWGHLAVGRSGSQIYHYSDVTMNTIASQITRVLIVCWSICSAAHKNIYI